MWGVRMCKEISAFNDFSAGLSYLPSESELKSISFLTSYRKSINRLSLSS